MKSEIIQLNKKETENLSKELKLSNKIELTNLLIGEGIFPRCKYCSKRLPLIYISQETYDLLIFNGESILSKSVLERYFPELKSYQISCFRNQVCYSCRNYSKRPGYSDLATQRQEDKKDKIKQSLTNAENPDFIDKVALMKHEKRSNHTHKFPKKFTAKQWSHITQLNPDNKKWEGFDSQQITRAEFLEKLNNK